MASGGPRRMRAINYHGVSQTHIPTRALLSEGSLLSYPGFHSITLLTILDVGQHMSIVTEADGEGLCLLHLGNTCLAALQGLLCDHIVLSILSTSLNFKI